MYMNMNTQAWNQKKVNHVQNSNRVCSIIYCTHVNCNHFELFQQQLDENQSIYWDCFVDEYFIEKAFHNGLFSWETHLLQRLQILTKASRWMEIISCADVLLCPLPAVVQRDAMLMREFRNLVSVKHWLSVVLCTNLLKCFHYHLTDWLTKTTKNNNNPLCVTTTNCSWFCKFIESLHKLKLEHQYSHKIAITIIHQMRVSFRFINWIVELIK